MILLIILSIVLTVSISFVSISLFTTRTRENRTRVAEGSSKIVSELVDGDKVDHWLKDGKDDDYINTYHMIESIMRNSSDLEYLYVYQIKEDGCYVVFDPDTETNEGNELNDVIDFDESFLKYKSTLLSGGRIETAESNDSFGWLLTHYEPIFDSSGKCVAYAGADVSMTEVNDYITSFINYITVFSVIVLVIIVFVGLTVSTGYHKTTLLEDMREQQKRDKKLLTEIIESFAKVIDLKDSYTQGHSMRVAKYTAMLAKELGCSEEQTELYYNIALMHDIGKVGIPDEVLNKPGKLTNEEYELIKSHTSRGYETLKNISLLPELAVGARSHHERHDGKGYPEGLKADEIPRVAQIIAVADCFDAMYSNRPYRKRMNFEKAVSIIKDVSGTQLTSDVVDAFLRLVEKGEFRAPDDHGGGSIEDISNIRNKTDADEKKEST